MKSSYIVNILLGILIALLPALVACKSNRGKQSHAGHQQEQLYTCPMHPEIIKNEPGKCPICGMDLVPKSASKETVIDSSLTLLTKPVNEQVIANVSAITPESGTRIVSSQVNGVVTYDTRNQTSIASRIGGRIERLLIKYNYQPVKKGQLILEIYSPDLAAAQRELLFISAGGNNEMLSRAKQKLQLLGMQPAQIEQVLKTGNILYRIPVFSNADGYVLEKSADGIQTPAPQPMAASASPASDGMGSMNGGSSSGSASAPAPSPISASPVLIREGQYVTAGQPLFTIYKAGKLVAEFAFLPELAARIKRGQKLLFNPASDKSDMQTGSIGLIEPVFRGGQNFTVARIYLSNSHLQVGQLLTGNIPVVYRNGWWLPKKAVWQLGSKAIVFRKENSVYVPVKVETGAQARDMVQVITDIGGWKVASNAWYLVDSESFIKTNNSVQQ